MSPFIYRPRQLLLAFVIASFSAGFPIVLAAPVKTQNTPSQDIQIPFEDYSIGNRKVSSSVKAGRALGGYYSQPPPSAVVTGIPVDPAPAVSDYLHDPINSIPFPSFTLSPTETMQAPLTATSHTSQPKRDTYKPSDVTVAGLVFAILLGLTLAFFFILNPRLWRCFGYRFKSRIPKQANIESCPSSTGPVGLIFPINQGRRYWGISERHENELTPDFVFPPEKKGDEPNVPFHISPHPSYSLSDSDSLASKCLQPRPLEPAFFPDLRHFYPLHNPVLFFSEKSYSLPTLSCEMQHRTSPSEDDKQVRGSDIRSPTMFKSPLLNGQLRLTTLGSDVDSWSEEHTHHGRAHSAPGFIELQKVEVTEWLIRHRKSRSALVPGFLNRIFNHE